MGITFVANPDLGGDGGGATTISIFCFEKEEKVQEGAGGVNVVLFAALVSSY